MPAKELVQAGSVHLRGLADLSPGRSRRLGLRKRLEEVLARPRPLLRKARTERIRDDDDPEVEVAMLVCSCGALLMLVDATETVTEYACVRCPRITHIHKRLADVQPASED